MRVFVTGFSSSLVQVLLKNIDQIELVKINSLTSSNSDRMSFNLDMLKDFKKGDYILHAAWNMKKRNVHESKKINVQGSIDFFDSLNKDQKKNFIFISSVGAIKDTRSIYGNHKLEIENFITSRGGRILRLGILFDEPADNLIFIQELKKTAKILPFVPNFSKKHKIYYITKLKHLNNYFNLLKRNQAPKNFSCHEKEPINFHQLVKNILKINKPIIPFPLVITMKCIKLINNLIPAFPLNVDSFEYIISMKDR